MHSFEIIEHTLCEQSNMFALVSEEKSFVEVQFALYSYLKRRRKILRIRGLKKFRRKIRKQIRRFLKSRRGLIFSLDSVQAV